MDAVNIKTRLQDYRLGKGLSINEMCDLLDVDYSTYTKWVRGDNIPRAKDLPKIAEVLGCDIDYLFSDNPLDKPHKTDNLIQQETGLSDLALSILREYNNYSGTDITAFNWLIEHGLISDICNNMALERLNSLNYHKPDIPEDIYIFAETVRKNCDILPTDDPEEVCHVYLKALIDNLYELHYKTKQKWEETILSKYDTVDDRWIQYWNDIYKTITKDKSVRKKEDPKLIKLGIILFMLTNDSFNTLERIDLYRYYNIQNNFNKLINEYTDELLSEKR